MPRRPQISPQQAGAALRARREELGLGASEVAQAIGVRESALVRMEEGKANIRRWHWSDRNALRRLFRWTITEFEQATGTRFPEALKPYENIDLDDRLIFEIALIDSGEYDWHSARRIANLIYSEKPPI